MDCTQCGSSNPPASKFCSECGAAIKRAAAPAAERRRITVMFCDLVGSTTLSETLDPEELRNLLRAYHDACTSVVRQFEGHVAQLLGDGVLVYFGYPVAHEDDVRRAVCSALAIIAAIRELRATTGLAINVRLGVHTGLVVVGEMGAGQHREKLALGQTPNLAARVQGAAESGTVAISGATLEIVRPYFEVENLGPHTLKGVAEPIPLYRVLGESDIKTRTDVQGLTPIVGRRAELEILVNGWEAALRGEGSVVTISGEAGIGKSRLLQVVKSHVAPEDGQLALCQCSPLHTNDALYPLVEFLEQVMGLADIARDERLAVLEERLERTGPFPEETLPLLAALLSIPQPTRHPVLDLPPAEQRTRTVQALAEWLMRAAERRPVLFLIEDLHWADPTTLEVIEAIMARTRATSLLCVATWRPEFQPTWQAIEGLTEITLDILAPEEIQAVAHHIAKAKALPAAVLAEVIARTGGIPLFVEEMTRAVLDTGQLEELDDRFELSGPPRPGLIPATLHDSLMARIDRLGPAKPLAQLASVIGRRFSGDVLKAVAERDDGTVERDLGLLVEAGVVFQEGEGARVSYLFKHALIRDAAYESLLRKTRQRYHRAIAEALRARSTQLAEAEPGVLAIHYEKAGMTERAIEERHHAGAQATSRGAFRETCAHLTHALGLLETLPRGADRDRMEMPLQLDLAPAHMAIDGWAHEAVARACNRAYELSQTVGEHERIVPLQWGLWANHLVGGRYDDAIVEARKVHDLATAAGRPEFLVMSYHSLIATHVGHGDFEAALELLPRAEQAFDLERERIAMTYNHLSSMVNCYGWNGAGLWIMGRFKEARELLEKFEELSQALGHAPTEALERWVQLVVLSARGRKREALDMAIAAREHATEHGFAFWAGVFDIYIGWARVLLGQESGDSGDSSARDASLEQMETGFAGWHAFAGKGVAFGHFVPILAEARWACGRHDDALAIADEGVEQRAWGFFQPQALQIQGEILASLPDRQAEAEKSLRQAIEGARAMDARAWQLRAAVSLGRLLGARGDRAEAAAIVRDARAGLELDADEIDLHDAQTLLDELGIAE